MLVQSTEDSLGLGFRFQAAGVRGKDSYNPYGVTLAPKCLNVADYVRNILGEGAIFVSFRKCSP